MLPFGAHSNVRLFSLRLINSMSATPQSATGYVLPTYEFKLPPELSGSGRSPPYPVVVVGAGLAGLTAACDLAQRGIAVLLIDEDDTIGVRGASSRGICYAQKSLEIFERLGTYDKIRAKGIQWSVGKTLAGNDIVYEFDLRQTMAHQSSVQPPFINLQQFYIEWFLVDQIQSEPLVDLRWKSKVLAVSQNDDGVSLSIECPAGTYQIQAHWLLDATGNRSPIRDGFGLKTNPAIGEDRWCISDVRFKHRPPIERWTWVEAPFNENRAVWQHLMGDDVWRLDYQMAPDADPEYVGREDVVRKRLQAQFGDDVEFEIVWVGPYSYRSHVLEQMRLKRVLFLGDSAHVMSPFGARGGNSAIQDADNVGWKLAQVVKGHAPDSLLDTYHSERHEAASLNVQITNRTMRFLTPQSPVQRLFRDAVIQLARSYPFARALVNTGRLSSPTEYQTGPLSFGKGAGISIANVPLSLADASVSNLVTQMRLANGCFIVLAVDEPSFNYAKAVCAHRAGFTVRLLCATDSPKAQWVDTSRYLHSRLGLHPGQVAVLRPDLHSAGTLACDQLEQMLAGYFSETAELHA